MTKYRAKKTECGSGHTHDSKMEARRCDELTALCASGEITDLEQQPTFPVVVNGQKVCTYIADFSYTMSDSGLHVVCDVKGVQTPVFNLKRKLVEALYPDTVITIWPPKIRKRRRSSKDAA